MVFSARILWQITRLRIEDVNEDPCPGRGIGLSHDVFDVFFHGLFGKVLNGIAPSVTLWRAGAFPPMITAFLRQRDTARNNRLEQPLDIYLTVERAGARKSFSPHSAQRTSGGLVRQAWGLFRDPHDKPETRSVQLNCEGLLSWLVMSHRHGGRQGAGCRLCGASVRPAKYHRKQRAEGASFAGSHLSLSSGTEERHRR